MNMWRVHATKIVNTMSGFTIKQIPTFYIGAGEHGILTGDEDHALKVAFRILEDACGDERAEFNVAVAEV